MSLILISNNHVSTDIPENGEDTAHVRLRKKTTVIRELMILILHYYKFFIIIKMQ